MSNNNIVVNPNIAAEIAALAEQLGRIIAKSVLTALLASVTMPAIPVVATPMAGAAPIADPMPEPIAPVTIDAPRAKPAPVAPRLPLTIADRISRRLADRGEQEWADIVRTLRPHARAADTKMAMYDMIGSGAVLMERRPLPNKMGVFLRLPDPAA